MLCRGTPADYVSPGCDACGHVCYELRALVVENCAGCSNASAKRPPSARPKPESANRVVCRGSEARLLFQPPTRRSEGANNCTRQLGSGEGRDWRRASTENNDERRTVCGTTRVGNGMQRQGAGDRHAGALPLGRTASASTAITHSSHTHDRHVNVVRCERRNRQKSVYS